MIQRRMSAERRREMLLDAVLDVVVAEGFHAATIDRVAREAGVTRTLLYSQFRDLAGMVSALVDRETEKALRGLAEALAPLPEDMDLVEVSEALLRATVHAVGLAPRSWQILLNPPDGGPPELHERIAAGRSMASAHVQELLISRLPEQLSDPVLTAHLHHLVGEELVRLHLRDPDAFPLARVVCQVRALAAGTLATYRKEPAG